MALNMSHLIAADAPLLSNTEAELFPTEPFNYSFFSLPPSPPLSDQPSPLRTPDPEPVCLPTHQVFDLAEVPRPSSPSSVASGSEIATTDTSSIFPTGSKRSASPGPPVAKKRAVAERVSTKDFIAPDVTGLSKREARLVKNRAAAFLSRQRKREEFENMEIRVAELEQENRRLLALAQQCPAQSSTTPPSDKLASEVESLKAQLAAAEEHARSLSAQLEQRGEASSSPVIKVGSRDTPSPSSPPRSTGLPGHKSSASLGLMVLLCALPSLLSMRIQSPASATNIDNGFTVSNTFHSSGARSAFDFDLDHSMFSPHEFDWSYSKTGSWVESDEEHTTKVGSGTRKLEFTGINSPEGETGLRDLGDLDISFDTAASDDGKIRVRIHPHSSASSSASSTSSRSVSRGTTPDGEDSFMSPSASSTSSPRSHPSALGVDTLSALSATSSDPFLGVTSLSDTDDIDMVMASYVKDDSSNLYRSTFDKGYSLLSSLSTSLSSLGAEYGVLDGLNTGGITHGKRRVKIALKSAPQAAAEGGEWEVQIC